MWFVKGKDMKIQHISTPEKNAQEVARPGPPDSRHAFHGDHATVCVQFGGVGEGVGDACSVKTRAKSEKYPRRRPPGSHQTRKEQTTWLSQ